MNSAAGCMQQVTNERTARSEITSGLHATGDVEPAAVKSGSAVMHAISHADNQLKLTTSGAGE